MKIISTENMPPAAGHYSQCIEHNGLLYLSGQLPRDPETGTIPKTIEEQTDLALMNVDTILTEAGSSRNKVLQVRIYISNIELWDKVNERYSVFLGNHKPARCVIPTRDLHFGCLVEIEVTAAIDK
jgi:2-iminobutanoate/2-iminopropanoate deaminase